MIENCAKLYLRPIFSTFNVPIERFLSFRLPKSHSFPKIHFQSLFPQTCNECTFTTVSRLCWIKNRTNPLCLTKRAPLAFRRNNLIWNEIKYDIHIQLQSASAYCHIPLRTINISSIRIIRFFQIAYPENSNNLLHIKVSWCYIKIEKKRNLVQRSFEDGILSFGFRFQCTSFWFFSLYIYLHIQVDTSELSILLMQSLNNCYCACNYSVCLSHFILSCKYGLIFIMYLDCMLILQCR